MGTEQVIKRRLFLAYFVVVSIWPLNCNAGKLVDILSTIGRIEQGSQEAERQQLQNELQRQQLEIQRLEIQKRQMELEQREAYRRQIEMQRREAEDEARRQNEAKQKEEAERIKREKEAISTGSGFFVTSDGYFVTNYHVIKDAKTIDLFNIDGGKFRGKIAQTDPFNDLAIIKVNGEFTALPIESSRQAKRGQSVATVGYPHADIQGVEPKVTEGVISSLSGISNDPRSFQISVPIQSGNSGGPLVTKEGNVIGIIVSKLSALAMVKQTGDMPQNVNYAIKSNYLLELLSTQKIDRRLSRLNKKAKNIEDIASFVEKATALVVASPFYVDEINSPQEKNNTTTRPQPIQVINQQWEKIDENEYKNIYLGRKGFSKTENLITTIVLIDFKKPTGSMSYLSITYDEIIDCKNNIFSTKNESYFSENFAKGVIIFSSSDETQMASPFPGSTDSIIVSKLCSLDFSSKNINQTETKEPLNKNVAPKKTNQQRSDLKAADRLPKIEYENGSEKNLFGKGRYELPTPKQ